MNFHAVFVAGIIFSTTFCFADAATTKADPDCAYKHPVSALYSKFLRACAQHDDQAAQAVIAAGLNVNEADEDGNTILCMAAREGAPGAMKALLAHGADPNAMTKYHYSVLRCAISGRNADAVACLLAAGVDVNQACDGDDYMPLMGAARLGQAEIVKLLLASGAKVKARARGGADALSEAASMGHADIIALLVDHGAEVNRIGTEGMTPLMGASLAGHLEAVKMLVAKGAKLDVQSDPYRETALSLASRPVSEPGRDHLGVVKFLLQKGAKPSIADKNGDTALTIATVYERTDVIKALATGGADMNSGEGVKALGWAISHEKTVTLQTLLDAGANPNAIVTNDYPALLYAIEISRSDALAAMLVRAKANVNVTRRQGLIGMVIVPVGDKPPKPSFYEYNALIAAVRVGSVPMVKTLLEADANPHDKDSEGKTALDRAREAKNPAMIALLR